MIQKKAIVLLTAACLSLGSWSLAKDKGTPTKFPNWGVIMVPDDLYMQQGRQPMLTAADTANDVVALFERVYPLQPETYQIIKKDDADFQYAYLLRYTATIWDVKAAIYGDSRENTYLRDIGSRPDMKILMNRANQNLSARLPGGFHVKEPITARKTNGHLFYEWTVTKDLVINSNPFVETIHFVAWQHGDTMEIAAILGNVAKEGGDDVIAAVTDMLKNAEKMPKK